jgi:hypothetical protein
LESWCPSLVVTLPDAKEKTLIIWKKKVSITHPSTLFRSSIQESDPLRVGLVQNQFLYLRLDYLNDRVML